MNIMKSYQCLSNRHCFEIIRFLFDNKVNFCVVCDLLKVNFEPLLPKEIFDKFRPFEVFILAGYTFESLRIYEDSIEFEAGFGNDNIGSIVSIKIEGIIQVIVKNKKYEDVVLFHQGDVSLVFDHLQEEICNPMEAILSNPQNRRIIKNIQQKNKKS
ncbi:hypothetical protein [Helicobacter sp. 11S03491-1]|uniref:hypothetical protein n=1 Tax=Helicobacter sp. 11S03491-1 TaxID=1476196 RepID=UPI000BA62AB6|nr:hypothetical protein [Helicobacter sp. 11S03491-1]PAF41456.1 hypothetical protein BKH45_06965 [Helicobacter sp. 11S03491-1]